MNLKKATNDKRNKMKKHKNEGFMLQIYRKQGMLGPFFHICIIFFLHMIQGVLASVMLPYIKHRGGTMKRKFI
jgi:hypothetical protein